MTKKPQPFNNPFGKLKVEPPKPTRAPAEKRPAPAPALPVEADEAALFLEAIGEVAPVRSKAIRVAPPDPPTADQLRIVSDDAEALAQLAQLVSSDGPFDLADSDEFIEGSVQGLDPGVMQRLRRGDFSVRAVLDLHGMTKPDAKAALERFILGAHKAGHRCVRVVTGRGLHSKDQLPVLKLGVQGWLTVGRAAKQVLGFATARPNDGGFGALYVLLRR